MAVKIVLGIFVLIFVAAFAKDDGPEVTIKQGALRGKIQKSRNGKPYNAFTGIPYAKPPVGQFRFKVSVPADPWEGLYDATRPHPRCPQINIFAPNASDTVIGEEDCLYLNVYTPQLPNSQKEALPVMFYIHGGGFIAGTASLHGAGLLIDKDVVLVTANYRLGPLGFLTTGDLSALGNDGLKDQYLAIKWTKDNIEKFGGDPNSITVFGQSAGGASAHYHMLSPLSKNLISGVIAQSGTALANWALMPHFLSTRRSKILAGQLGCPTRYVDEMMECMREVDAHDIIKATNVFVEWGDVDPIIPFKPVIELIIPGAFLPEDPIDIIRSGKAANIPLMTGLTSSEGATRTISLYKNSDLLKEFDEDFDRLGPLVLIYSETAANKYKETVTKEIRNFYFGDQPIDESTKTQFTEMAGDATILAGEDVAVELHAKFSKKPLYYYLFDYKGSASFCTVFNRGVCEYCGVCHCDELPYLFNPDLLIPDYKSTEDDVKVSDFMTTLWTNFAKYGNPTPETDSTISVKWESAVKGKQNYYHIKSASEVVVEQDLFSERAKFWRNLHMSVRTGKIRDEL